MEPTVLGTQQIGKIDAVAIELEEVRELDSGALALRVNIYGRQEETWSHQAGYGTVALPIEVVEGVIDSYRSMEKVTSEATTLPLQATQLNVASDFFITKNFAHDGAKWSVGIQSLELDLTMRQMQDVIALLEKAVTRARMIA